MAEVLSIDFGKPFPVFPLQDCALFPSTILPLHVFEPRYRTMVAEALDSHGLIAMAMFSDTVARDEYLHERPPLRPAVCVGHIRQYEGLADGRYVMLLQGLCRARVSEEVTHEPYRLFRLAPFGNDRADEREMTPHRSRIEKLLDDPAILRIEAVADLREQLKKTRTTSAFVDMLISALCRNAEQRYAMLNEPNAIARAEWLVAYMQAVRRRLVN